MLCLKLLILGLVCLTSYRSVSSASTTAGDAEFRQKRVHLLIISNDANTTALIYTNTGADFEPIVATFENSLPPLSLCGADNDRCNILVTSNTDKSIQVVLLPLESGIGLVSFDSSTLNDSLIYRDQFLVSQGIPDCTFVFFVEELQVIIGYCLESEPAKLYAFRIRINFTSLNSSTIVRREDASEVQELLNIANLSNLVYFIRHEFDGCFQNERNHVIFLDQGDLFDHSFMDGRFLFPHIRIDSSCSRLHRIGDECGLATHCDGRVVLFDTREHIEQISITEAEYGQTFFCRSGDFIGFEREMLNLYDKDRQPFGNRVPFPFGKIHRGRCVNVNDNFFFVATIDSSSTSTILVNFSDTTYQHLGSSDLSMVVPARVKGEIAIVNNGSVSEIYNLGLMCTPEPLLVHESNFVLANFFTSETMDRYWCLNRGPSPTEVTVTIPASATSTLTFVSDPVNNQTNSSQVNVIAIAAGTVGCVLLLVALTCTIAITCVCILAWIKRKGRSPADYGLADLRLESPMSHPEKSDKDVNKTDNVDQSSSSAVESFESQETLEPLLNSQPTDALNINPHLTQVISADQHIPRLDCIEDILTDKPTVYENHSSRDQLTGSLRQSTSTELIPGAWGNVEPVPCTSPSQSPRHKGGAAAVPPRSSKVSDDQSGHPRPTVAYQGNNGRPCSSVSEGSCNAAGCMQPIQEERHECCGHGYMVEVQPPNANFDRRDVKMVYNGLDNKMNEQGYRAHVDTIANGDSQSQNSEPNNDNLPLDRQRSNDSQENEN